MLIHAGFQTKTRKKSLTYKGGEGCSVELPPNPIWWWAVEEHPDLPLVTLLPFMADTWPSRAVIWKCKT